MKFSIKDFFSKCFQRILRIWLHLLKKSLTEKFIFCAVVAFYFRPTSLFMTKILSTYVLLPLRRYAGMVYRHTKALFLAFCPFFLFISSFCNLHYCCILTWSRVDISQNSNSFTTEVPIIKSRFYKIEISVMKELK